MQLTEKRKPHVPMIELEPVVTMRKLLNQYDKKWSMELAELMYPRSEEEKMLDPRNLINQRKVINIAQGVTKNGAARATFLVHGKQLLDRYKAEYDSAMLIQNEMKLAATA